VKQNNQQQHVVPCGLHLEGFSQGDCCLFVKEQSTIPVKSRLQIESQQFCCSDENKSQQIEGQLIQACSDFQHCYTQNHFFLIDR
jgi:hypothetical protein